MTPVVGFPSDTPEPFLAFAASIEEAELGQFEQRYPLHEQADIVAVSGVGDATGNRVLRLDIYAPAGNLYQTIYRAFSSDADAPQTMPHPITGEAMPIDRVAGSGGIVRVFIGIPIAGTNLTRYNIDGIFNVTSTIDGDSAPVATATFELYQ